jgi:hypothetical protein
MDGKGGAPRGEKIPLPSPKEAARDYVRERVVAALEPLLDAQIAHATGVSHVFLRNRQGHFEQVADPHLIAAAPHSGDQGTYYRIFTKDPSVQAASLLLAYALDKPKEQMDLQVSGTVDIVRRLLRARQRIKA